MKELKTASLSEIPERLEKLLIPENGYSRKTKNILVRYARWSLTYNKVMMKSDTKYVNFELFPRLTNHLDILENLYPQGRIR